MKKSFKAVFKELRGDRSMKEFADLLGISAKSYEHYEYGTRKPTLEVILQIVEVCNVSSDYVLWVSDDHRHAKPSSNISVNGSQNAILNGHAVAVASEMGHGGTSVFFKHYRALAKPGDGKKWFAIEP